jgi:RNA polymerase I-specific transcription initiation factor RRN7
MDSAWTKGPVCGIENCRSRLYEEGEDGYQYCQNGHRRGDVLVVGQDDDDFNPLVRRQRAKKPEETEKVQQYFKGHAAFDLYLKCFQLVLRHQLRFLIHTKGLPAELESIVLDLWALRIIQLENRAADTAAEDSQSQFLTTSESEKESEHEQSRTSRQGRRLNATPSFLESLALCYLGMHTLHLPITLGDLRGWATNGEMVYFRAIKHIPPSMRDRLPAQYHGALDPNGVLKLERLHKTVLDLVLSYGKEYGVVFPPRNNPLLLFRYLIELALPLGVYDATIKLAGYLGYNFSFPPEMKTRKSIRGIPDAQIASLLVVCVKLIYPFDGKRRYPHAASEPSAIVLDWNEWWKHISFANKQSAHSPQWTADELMKLTEKDVFTMSDSSLDQYLDWYQRTWIDDRVAEKSKHGDFQRALYDMFPIDRKEGITPKLSQVAENDGGGVETEMAQLRAVHTSLRARRAQADEEMDGGMLRPGSGYKHYRHATDLPETARRFYEVVASRSGLSLEMLTKAVYLTERQVLKWAEAKRKGQELNN